MNWPYDTHLLVGRTGADLVRRHSCVLGDHYKHGNSNTMPTNEDCQYAVLTSLLEEKSGIAGYLELVKRVV